MKQLASKQCQPALPLNSWLVFIYFSLVLGIWKKYLPDDHEKVYSSHSLKWRLGVEPSNVGPASRSELKYSSFDFPSGGVDVPERREQLQWKSEEIRKGKKKKKPQNQEKNNPVHWLFTTKEFLSIWIVSPTMASLFAGEALGNFGNDRHSTELRSLQSQGRP